MKELSLREIQIGEFNILKTIAEICEREGFSYYIFYGTLLGAVRNSGFIPWDDDIDVIMPRDDYERLLKYLKVNSENIKPLQLIHYTNNDNYIYPIARISDDRFKIEFDNIKDYGIGLFIDIYPLDGCGQTVEEAKKCREKMALKKILVGIGSINKFKKSTKNVFRTIVKFIAFSFAKILGVHRLIKELDETSARRKFDQYDYVGCLAWEVTGVGYYKKKMLQDYIMLEFEGYKFRAPKYYNELLYEIYGNYMMLPPVEDRIAHHYYRAYLKWKKCSV